MSVAGWAIAAAAIVCIVLRPFRISEAWWATAGALGLILCGAIAPLAALRALGRGTDVYLFLIGMMALAEYAKAEGVFAWLAAQAVRAAGTSRARLFALVYGTGIATTALLSNDATVVVLTPAVIAAVRRCGAPPLPYVVACALVANAASFVLPISNPSNLLVFAGRMPPLAGWLAVFALPSLAAIGVTFAVARLAYRRELRAPSAAGGEPVPAPARLATIALVLAAAVVVATSALGGPLGAATCACGAATWLATLVRDRSDAGRIGREIAWPIVVLTAALFVIVTAVDGGGGFAASSALIDACARLAAPWPALATGFAVAVAANAANNLPVSLNLGEVLPATPAVLHASQAALVGVNLGPNATVNGSLATVLWLAIVRRADVEVTPLAFARVGIPATIAALAAALLLLPR